MIEIDGPAGLTQLKRDRNTFIAMVNQLYPRWSGVAPRQKWLSHPEAHPLTDPHDALENAIKDHILDTDVVLTIPTHYKYFVAIQPREVHMYDLSVAQLIGIRVSSTLTGVYPRIFWMDLFHPEMLKEVLEQVQPSAISVSNIPDYTQNMDELEGLVEMLHNFLAVQKIFFSFINDVSPGAEEFTQFLIQRGWHIDRYYSKKFGAIDSGHMLVASRTKQTKVEPTPSAASRMYGYT